MNIQTYLSGRPEAISGLFLYDRSIERWTPQDVEALRKLYLVDKLPIAGIAMALKRSPASINTALSKCGVSRQRWVRKFRMPTRMTPALARIHAHVCGDGHLVRYRERDDYGYLKAYKLDRYRWRYGLGYTNLNLKLIRSFMADTRQVFGLKPLYFPHSKSTRLKSKDAWDLLAQLGAGGSRAWSIPKEISQGNSAIKTAWLSAFFDDEAHFVPNGGIRVRSVNRPGLEQAAQMLRQFVPCHLTPAIGLYPDSSCYLAVPKSARRRFLELIGSTKCQE